MFEKPRGDKRPPQRIKWGNVAKAVAAGAVLLVALVWALGPLLGGGTQPKEPAAGYTDVLKKPEAQQSETPSQLADQRQEVAEAAALKRSRAVARRKRTAGLRAERKRQRAKRVAARRAQRKRTVLRSSSQQSSSTLAAAQGAPPAESSPPVYEEVPATPETQRSPRGSEFLFG